MEKYLNAMIKFNECDKRSPDYIKQFDADGNPIQQLSSEELSDLEDDYENDLIKEIKSITEVF